MPYQVENGASILFRDLGPFRSTLIDLVGTPPGTARRPLGAVYGMWVP
ncbi:hypothetical protein AB0K60_36745 [Thermopolyspora sp. NPDC052614]